jgi:hypothetical protein
VHCLQNQREFWHGGVGTAWLGGCLAYLHFGSRVSQPRRQSRHRLQAGSDWIRASRSMSAGVVLLDAVDMARHGVGVSIESVEGWD